MGNECSACSNCQKTEKQTEFTTDNQSPLVGGDTGNANPTFDPQTKGYNARVNDNFDDPEHNNDPRSRVNNANNNFNSLLNNNFQNQSLRQSVPNKDNGLQSSRQNFAIASQFTDEPQNDDQIVGGGILDSEPKYFTKDEQRETLSQNIGNPNVRERRPPYQFKSGAYYEGEWLGIHSLFTL